MELYGLGAPSSEGVRTARGRETNAACGEDTGSLASVSWYSRVRVKR